MAVALAIDHGDDVQSGDVSKTLTGFTSGNTVVVAMCKAAGDNRSFGFLLDSNTPDYYYDEYAYGTKNTAKRAIVAVWLNVASATTVVVSSSASVNKYCSFFEYSGVDSVDGGSETTASGTAVFSALTTALTCPADGAVVTAGTLSAGGNVTAPASAGSTWTEHYNADKIGTFELLTTSEVASNTFDMGRPTSRVGYGAAAVLSPAAGGEVTTNLATLTKSEQAATIGYDLQAGTTSKTLATNASTIGYDLNTTSVSKTVTPYQASLLSGEISAGTYTLALNTLKSTVGYDLKTITATKTVAASAAELGMDITAGVVGLTVAANQATISESVDWIGIDGAGSATISDNYGQKSLYFSTDKSWYTF